MTDEREMSEGWTKETRISPLFALALGGLKQDFTMVKVEIQY